MINNNSNNTFNKYCKYPKGEEKTKNIILYGFIFIIILISITITLLIIYNINVYIIIIPTILLFGIIIIIEKLSQVKCNEIEMGNDLKNYISQELKNLKSNPNYN